MTKLWIAEVVLAAALATTVAAAERHPEFILQSGGHAFGHAFVNNGGSFDQADLKSRFGDRFAAFTQDGRRYVITNEAVLGQLEALYKPMVALGQEQAVLGGKQASLGAEQAHLGGEQARLAADQIALAHTDTTATAVLGETQRSLGERQRRLGVQQRALGQQQAELGRKQKAVTDANMPKIERMFDDAVKSGVAVEIR